jgi:hypothetical protein
VIQVVISVIEVRPGTCQITMACVGSASAAESDTVNELINLVRQHADVVTKRQGGGTIVDIDLSHPIVGGRS